MPRPLLAICSYVRAEGIEPTIHADYVIYSHTPNQLEHYSQLCGKYRNRTLCFITATVFKTACTHVRYLPILQKTRESNSHRFYTDPISSRAQQTNICLLSVCVNDWFRPNSCGFSDHCFY